MLNTVMLPLDGSAVSEAALPWAKRIAHSTGACLIVTRVVPWPNALWLQAPEGYISAELYQEIVDAEAEAAERYLGEVRERLTAEGLRVETVSRHGSPAHCIADLADERGVSLIAMATHGRGGLARLTLGSVAQQMLQQATVPLLLVRARAEPAPREPSLARILVPLDGSPLAERALDLTLELGPEPSARLLMQVVPPVERLPRGGGVATTYVDQEATRPLC